MGLFLINSIPICVFHYRTFSSGPPVSNEQTVVWHFELNGIECTVMYDKQDMTVWCNGEDLETVVGTANGIISPCMGHGAGLRRSERS